MLHHKWPDTNVLPFDVALSVKAIVYFHIRVVKENYRPEDLAAELEHVTADAATPYENMDTADEFKFNSHGPEKMMEIV